MANQIYKAWRSFSSQDLPGETYESALVFTIKMREELVEASLRDQVIFRERKALRIKCSGLNTSQ